MQRNVKVEKTRTVDWSFRTIKQLLEKLSHLIDSPEYIDCHQTFLLSAVNNYDKVYEQASPAVRVYSDFPAHKGDHLGMGKYRCLHVVLENGKVLTVAKDAVARAAKDPIATAVRRKVDARTKALRTAVADQIQDFKAAKISNENLRLRAEAEYAWECGNSDYKQLSSIGTWCFGIYGMEFWQDDPQCKLHMKTQPWSDLQVDHCGTMEFRHIVDAFGDRPLHEQWGDFKHWKAFHKEHAKLQLICKTCNLKKPKHTHEQLVEIYKKRDEYGEELRRKNEARKNEERQQKLIEPKEFCKIPMV